MAIAGTRVLHPFIVVNCSIYVAYVTGAEVNGDPRFFKSAVSGLRLHSTTKEENR